MYCFESVFDLSIEQLRDELIILGHDVKGWTKPAMQKCLCKISTDKGNVEGVSELQLKMKQLELEERKEERLAEERRQERLAEEKKDERLTEEKSEKRRLEAEEKEDGIETNIAFS